MVLGGAIASPKDNARTLRLLSPPEIITSLVKKALKLRRGRSYIGNGNYPDRAGHSCLKLLYESRAEVFSTNILLNLIHLLLRPVRSIKLSHIV